MSTTSDRIIAIQQAVEFDATGKPLVADGIPGVITEYAIAAMIAADKSGTPWPPASPEAASVPPQTPGTIMVGDDSVEPFSSMWLSRMVALTGVKPKWIGRYIGRGSKPATYQLLASEFAPAAAAGVKFLLIAEQTTSVSGTEQQGYADGQGNAQNIFSLFGAANLPEKTMVFLDVEGSPDLTAAYYTGWERGLTESAATLGAGIKSLLPCIYASENDGQTWKRLSAAIAAGSHCASAWVASYLTTSKVPIAPSWDASRARMNTGDNTPSPQCPVDIWQFAGGYAGTPYEALDPDSVNPSTDAAAFLSRCVTPPAPIA
jgi:hypothetical protein